MRLYKRRRIWWADFSINPQRHRVSLETTHRRKALSEANDKVSQATAGKLTAAAWLALPKPETSRYHGACRVGRTRPSD